MGSLKVRKNSARSFLGFAQHIVSITKTSLVYEPIIYGLFVVPIVDYDKIILMDSHYQKSAQQMLPLHF